MNKAMLINYDYCTGCHTCEIACQKIQGLAPDVYGIKLTQIGPDKIDENTWQFDYLPVPTDRCDHCESRTQHGKMPLCVQSCYSGCIEVGSIEELVPKIASKKYALYV